MSWATGAYIPFRPAFLAWPFVLDRLVGTCLYSDNRLFLAMGIFPLFLLT